MGICIQADKNDVEIICVKILMMLQQFPFEKVAKNAIEIINPIDGQARIRVEITKNDSVRFYISAPDCIPDEAEFTFDEMSRGVELILQHAECALSEDGIPFNQPFRF